jgi:hypothetical protein
MTTGRPSMGWTCAGTKAGGSPPRGRRRAIPFPPVSYGARDLISRDRAPRGAHPSLRVPALRQARPRYAPCGASFPRHIVSGTTPPVSGPRARRRPRPRQGWNTALPAPQRTGALARCRFKRERSAGNVSDGSPARLHLLGPASRPGFQPDRKLFTIQASSSGLGAELNARSCAGGVKKNETEAFDFCARNLARDGR